MDVTKLIKLEQDAYEIAIEARWCRFWEKDIKKIENLQYIESVAERVKSQVHQCLHTLKF